MKHLLVLSIVVLIGLAPSASAGDAATIALYKAKCAACHAPDGTANTPAGQKLGTPSFKSPEVMKMSDKELLDITAKGKAKMPPFDKKLSPEQLQQLVSYIRELMNAKK